MKFGGAGSSTLDFFLSIKGSTFTIYRQTCMGSRIDRRTGLPLEDKREKFCGCGIFKPIRDRQIVQDNGADRARGRARLYSKQILYTTDERDGLDADYIYIKGSYWKVMSTTDHCSYHEAELELLPEDICRGFSDETGFC